MFLIRGFDMLGLKNGMPRKAKWVGIKSETQNSKITFIIQILACCICHWNCWNTFANSWHPSLWLPYPTLIRCFEVSLETRRGSGSEFARTWYLRLFPRPVKVRDIIFNFRVSVLGKALEAVLSKPCKNTSPSGIRWEKERNHFELKGGK